MKPGQVHAIFARLLEGGRMTGYVMARFLLP